MKYTFDIFSSQMDLMVPQIVLDLPSVVWVSTNVFWYYNDDLGLVGMSICPKKVFQSVYTQIPVQFLCNPFVLPSRENTQKINFDQKS